jgi:hypothetical protein
MRVPGSTKLTAFRIGTAAPAAGTVRVRPPHPRPALKRIGLRPLDRRR